MPLKEKSIEWYDKKDDYVLRKKVVKWIEVSMI